MMHNNKCIFCHFPAQESGKGCQRPQLDNGFVDPEQNMYQDGMTLTYACDKGLKTPMEGWWGMITCENGRWSDTPRCTAKGLMKEGMLVRSCDAPPQVNHATVVQQYHNNFSNGSKVVYKCKRSYIMEGKADVVCLLGEWTSAPTCSEDRIFDRCGEKPTVDNGDFISDSDRNRMALTFTCINYYKLVGPEQVMCYNDQRWSELPICKVTDSWQRPFVADVQCQNGQVAIGRCACMYDELHTTQRNRLYST
uniref:Sushi domain-containing protein n=1 Tax=Oncorhynchus kisutch TaxID=8019 RepID=A0A8C7N681_ONCKI